MQETNQKNDRRKDRRYLTPEGTFAVLMPGYKNMGRIKDISRGGLAYHYIGNGEASNGNYRMDIFSSGKDFYLKEIPFQTVSILDKVEHFPFSSRVLKQLCIKFGRLSKEQNDLLEHFFIRYIDKNHPVKDRRQKDKSRLAEIDRRRNLSM
ncbi:hypothetical protein ACFLZL_02630 [Thermodesulfobacteriota bacterium]